MSTESTNFSDPRFNAECLEHLATEGLAEGGAVMWAEIHEEVQRVLESLDEQVRSRVAHLQVKPGRTRGRSFYLFTYRTFSRTDATKVDPVVVGLTFSQADKENAAIEADISGESNGDGIKRLASRTVPALPKELLRAAHELARELSRYGERIAEALLDSSRST